MQIVSICVKCQSLFSGKKKKKIQNLTAKIFHQVLSVKLSHGVICMKLFQEEQTAE